MYSYLFLLHDNITNGFQYITLNIIAIIAILSGIFVIVSKNPIVSVLYLIGLFLSISIYLMLLGINFIGLSYLLVYVGAVSILFLFILMLINIRISEIISATKKSIPLGIIIGTVFFTTLYPIIPNSNVYNDNSNNIYNNIDNNIDYNIYNNYNFLLDHDAKKDFLINDTGFLSFILYKLDFINNYNHTKTYTYFIYTNTWENLLAVNSHINTIGNILYTSFPLWIILTSLILLLAMVGAIIITLKN